MSLSTSQAVASLQAEVHTLRHEITTLNGKGSSTAAEETLYVGQYLVERLVQLGITVRTSAIIRSPTYPNRGAENVRCPRRL